MIQTRTKKTEDDYIKKSIQSMSFVYKKYKGKEQAEKIKYDVFLNEKKYTVVPLFETVVWFCKNKAHNYKSSTWRYYRSSFLYYAKILLNEEKISNINYEKLKELLEKTKSGEKEFLPERTSAKKSKYINDKDLKILINELKKSNNKWKVTTIIWIQSGILTGLRPVEWNSAEIIADDNKFIIKVKNAKNTNNRSHGEYRKIDLSYLEKKEKDMIDKQIKIAKNFYEKNIWKEYYEGCSNLLRYTTRKIFKDKKKFPTLYSCRHQFSANIKASGYTTNEVAALMGHASDKTAQEHYGKKRYGKKGKGPKVDKLDLENVKIKSKNFFSFDGDKK